MSSTASALPPFLTDAELAGICEGVTLPGAQCRHLERLGLLVKRKPNGRPLVARSEFERVKNPPPAVALAEEKPPARKAWEDTPLGRWQKEQRQFRAEQAAADAEALAAWRAEQKKLSPVQRRAQRRAREEAARLERAALVRFHAAKRRTVKMQRTPAWADYEAIRAVYLRAQQITAETGVTHHVDHDIPLQGKMVSGLHVHNNLQILTGSENSRKHNRFHIDP